MHEPKNRVNVRLVNTSPGEFWKFVIIYAPSTIPECLVSLKFDPDKSRKLAILESPEVSTLVNSAGDEASPKDFFYDIRRNICFYETERIEFCTKGN
jgi:hypothetical protein